MRERRELYPEGESPAIPKPEVIPNSVLDNPKLFELQASCKANLKKFSFKIFGRTFRFETYTIKKTNNKIFEPVEVCSSSEQAAWLCKMNKERSDKMFILSIPQIINENDNKTI